MTDFPRFHVSRQAAPLPAPRLGGGDATVSAPMSPVTAHITATAAPISATVRDALDHTGRSAATRRAVQSHSRSLRDLIDEFEALKQASGCSPRTLSNYRWALERFRTYVGDDLAALDTTAAGGFLADLRVRGLSASSVHDVYRPLKTFTRWLQAIGVLDRDPLVGLTIRTPTTLPQVPTDAELRVVLERVRARTDFEAVRNFALVLVPADAGPRVTELVRLRKRDWDPEELSLIVRSGKGRKDRVVFISPTTAAAIQRHLAMRPDAGPDDPLFADRDGCPLTPRNVVTILHRLSRRAGLPPSRRLHPHSLRGYAATSWIRAGMNLDAVRRLLGHASIAMTLRYSALVAADLQRAHQEASAIDRLLSAPAARRALASRTRRAPRFYAS